MVEIWVQALLHRLGHKWRHNKISFNNQLETREAPVPLTGEQVLRTSEQVLQQYESFEQVTFGKASK